MYIDGKVDESERGSGVSRRGGRGKRANFTVKIKPKAV
jgi:hypothetical protein